MIESEQGHGPLETRYSASKLDFHAAVHESSQLSGLQLRVRFALLFLGMLLIGQALLQPYFSHRESVERRFLRSSHVMSRRRVPPRKGPFEEGDLHAGAASDPLDAWELEGGSGIAGGTDGAGVGDLGSRNGSECRRLLWIVTMGANSSAEEQQHLQVALLSAQRHAPSLMPVLLHASASQQPDAVTRWFVEQGGAVVWHQLSFLSAFSQVEEGQRRDDLLKRQAAYFMLDLPIVMDRLIEEDIVDLHNTSTATVLYTHSDVLFLGGGSSGGEFPGDLSTCTAPAPHLVMLGREQAAGAPRDSGVLLVNVPALRAELPRLLRFGAAAGWDFPGWEQGLLNAYLRQHTPSLELLPDGLSWKAFWGSSASVALLHWLGPKPEAARCMQCYLANRAAGPDWARAGRCPCSRVPYKQLLQQSPDNGRMYAQALEAYESYLGHAGVVAVGHSGA